MAAALIRAKPIPLIGWARIITRILTMAMLLAVCVPLYYFCRLFGLRNPLPRLFLGGISWIAGVELRVRGEKVHRGAFLLANHVSWMDIPAIAATTGSAFIGHDGLMEMPFLRWLCAMNDTVFVARYDPSSVAEQVAAVRAAIKDTGALTIFPEGTTSDGTGLLPFKSSLLSALDPVPPGIAIQPVLLDYGPEAADIAWIGVEHGLDNFKRIMARGRALVVTVHFLPVLEGQALIGRKAMASAARGAMLQRLAG
jgi:1-acyl-sn-glycerol-3-phosphate acyltransferase